MALHTLSASADIAAPAARAYHLIADYRAGHPRILPKPPFISLDVEAGGVGAGTVVRCKMRFLGLVQTFWSDIEEPEPGRLLVERIRKSGMVTRFVVEPLAPDLCRVTIATDVPVLGGWLGRLQGKWMEKVLLPTYRAELGLLAEVAGADAT